MHYCKTKLIDILLRRFLKHIKSSIRDILDFLVKSQRGVDKPTEKVTFEVIDLYTTISHEFGLNFSILF